MYVFCCNGIHIQENTCWCLHLSYTCEELGDGQKVKPGLLQEHILANIKVRHVQSHLRSPAVTWDLESRFLISSTSRSSFLGGAGGARYRPLSRSASHTGHLISSHTLWLYFTYTQTFGRGVTAWGWVESKREKMWNWKRKKTNKVNEVEHNLTR